MTNYLQWGSENYMPRKAKPVDRTICRSRKARFRYTILEEIECGIVLTGTEVKSLRARTVSIEEAYARIERGELWLIGCHVSPYKHGTIQEHDPTRRRKLLVRGRELRKLRPKVEQKGQTLIPLSMHFNERGIAKVVLGLAVGKKLHDKRQTLRDRQHKREMDRATKWR